MRAPRLRHGDELAARAAGGENTGMHAHAVRRGIDKGDSSYR